MEWNGMEWHGMEWHGVNNKAMRLSGVIIIITTTICNSELLASTLH